MTLDNRTTNRVFDVTVRNGDEWVRLWCHRSAEWFSMTASSEPRRSVGTKVRVPTCLAHELGAALLDLRRWEDQVDLR